MSPLLRCRDRRDVAEAALMPTPPRAATVMPHRVAQTPRMLPRCLHKRVPPAKRARQQARFDDGADAARLPLMRRHSRAAGKWRHAMSSLFRRQHAPKSTWHSADALIWCRYYAVVFLRYMVVKRRHICRCDHASTLFCCFMAQRTADMFVLLFDVVLPIIYFHVADSA